MPVYRPSVPSAAGLRLGGGAAEQEVFQCFAVPREEGPEVTHAAEGGRGDNGQKYQRGTDEKSKQPAECGCNQQENAVDPQCVRKLLTGEGQGG